MQLAQAARILGAVTPEAAGASVIIKRTLRQQKLAVPDEPDALAGYFIANPWACTTAIDRVIELSKAACERLAYKRMNVELLMSLVDVRITWTGLYPTFVYTKPKPELMPPGIFAAECYSLEQLWRLLRDVRRYES